MIKHVGRAILIVAWLVFTGAVAIAAEAKRPAEWDKVVEEARKEGKIVLAIPPATELRTALEPLLKQKFGLEAELSFGARTEEREPNRRGEESRRKLF